MSESREHVETPSGKGAGDENFPVALVFPRALRPDVNVYYAFARAIDDIADSPDLSPEDKVARLDAFDRAVSGDIVGQPGLEKGYAVRERLRALDIPLAHARDLVVAFKQDAVKLRYRDWDDLMGYCNNSAAPVGRFLLDLHGEDRRHYRESDALCNALQVINHLQDCKDDYLNLDRVYVPEPWLAAEGCAVEDLAAERASPGVRRVLDRLLDDTDRLMVDARRLPFVMRDRRLALDCAFIVKIADRLIGLLRANDPIAGRVQLNRWQFAGCGLAGLLQIALRRAPRDD